MKRIEIKSTEYKIVNQQDDLVLYTIDLKNEIACSFFSLKLMKAYFARNINEEQLKKIFMEINPENIEESGLIKIHIVGGDISEESKTLLTSLVGLLYVFRDIIDIKSFDTCTKYIQTQ